jgi:hypothetical protein
VGLGAFSVGRVFQAIPVGSEIQILRDLEDLAAPFRDWSWQREHPSEDPGGYMSVEWRMVFDEQQRKGMSGQIRKRGEATDANFIPLRMIAT